MSRILLPLSLVGALLSAACAPREVTVTAPVKPCQVLALRDVPVGPDAFVALDDLPGLVVTEPATVALLAVWIVSVAEREEALARCPHLKLVPPPAP